MGKRMTLGNSLFPALLLASMGQGCSTLPSDAAHSAVASPWGVEAKRDGSTGASPSWTPTSTSWNNSKDSSTVQAADTAPASAAPLALSDLLRMTLERNPQLAQATFAIEAARGRAVQAGLYPNPTVRVSADELGDRTAAAGIWTAPAVTQDIVTANKLGISQAAAMREVDQATLALFAERFARLTSVRRHYFDVLTLQRRAAILDELVQFAEQSVATTEKLLDAKQVARLDLIQLEIELERFRAEQEATQRELPAAFRRLAASVGVPNLPEALVAGSLEMSAPDYDLEKARLLLLQIHPEVRAARVGVERAQLLLKRAQVEPIPNVNIGASYIRQFENRSHDAGVTVSVPVPLWNKNQGNIQAAQAEVGEAVAQVGRIENELTDRLATAYGAFASARQRSARYRATILPKARESYQLSLKAYQGGQFEYLRVLQAQRSVAEANLDYVRSLGELWRSASDIAGLLLEEDWPSASLPPAPAAAPKED